VEEFNKLGIVNVLNLLKLNEYATGGKIPTTWSSPHLVGLPAFGSLGELPAGGGFVPTTKATDVPPVLVADGPQYLRVHIVSDERGSKAFDYRYGTETSSGIKR
jgi:hypothetical protein